LVKGALKGLSKEYVEASLKNMTREDLVKMLNATEDLAISGECKFKLYEPVSPVAREFHKSKAMIRLLLGGNRASKSVTATVDTEIYTTKQVPDSLKDEYPKEKLHPEPVFVRINATDYPNGIQKIIKPKLLEWAPADAFADYSEDLQVATFIDGSKIELMTYEQPLLKHGGTARHRIQFDEEPPETYYDEGLLRITDYDGDIVIAMTPVNGMTWVYDRIYLRASRIVAMTTDEDGKRVLMDQADPEGDPDIEVFVMATKDNPHLSQKAISKVEEKIYDEEEKRMRLLGEFVSFSGLVYKNYSSKIHDVPPFAIPDIPQYLANPQKESNLPWPVYCALDPHPRTEHAYLMCAVDPAGRKFFFSEFFEDLDIDNLATRIKVIEAKYWLIWRLIDPSADVADMVNRSSHDATEGLPSTLFTELQKRGLAFQMAPKALSSGIMRVKEGLALRKRRTLDGHELAMPEIYFFNNLKVTKWEIQRYVWDRWRRSADSEKSPKQHPKDKDDHMMENLYRIMLREPCWLDYREHVVKGDLGDDWRRV